LVGLSRDEGAQEAGRRAGRPSEGDTFWPDRQRDRLRYLGQTSGSIGNQTSGV